MPAPRHDSFSISQDGKLSQDLHDHVSPSNVLGVQDNIARTSSFSKKKLMRGPEAEPRDFVYVYDYSENKTRRMKTETLLQQLGTDCPLIHLPYHRTNSLQRIKTSITRQFPMHWAAYPFVLVTMEPMVERLSLPGYTSIWRCDSSDGWACKNDYTSLMPSKLDNSLDESPFHFCIYIC